MGLDLNVTGCVAGFKSNCTNSDVDEEWNKSIKGLVHLKNKCFYSHANSFDLEIFLKLTQ